MSVAEQEVTTISKARSETISFLTRIFNKTLEKEMMMNDDESRRHGLVPMMGWMDFYSEIKLMRHSIKLREKMWSLG